MRDDYTTCARFFFVHFDRHNLEVPPIQLSYFASLLGNFFVHELLPPPSLSPPPAEDRDPSILDMEDTIVSQRYAQRAQELLSSFPPSCPSLKPHDLELTGRYPIAAGGFANIWEATYHNRKVVLKSYRHYASFDTSAVDAVRGSHSYRKSANRFDLEVPQRSSRMQPAPPRRRERTIYRGVLNGSPPLRHRLRVHGKP